MYVNLPEPNSKLDSPWDDVEQFHWVRSSYLDTRRQKTRQKFNTWCSANKNV